MIQVWNTLITWNNEQNKLKTYEKRNISLGRINLVYNIYQWWSNYAPRYVFFNVSTIKSIFKEIITIIFIIISNLKAFYAIHGRVFVKKLKKLFLIVSYDVDVQSICQKHQHIHLSVWYFYPCKANDWVKFSEYVSMRDETHGISGVFLNMENKGNNSIK